MDEGCKRELLQDTVRWLVDERRAHGGWLPVGLPGHGTGVEELWASFRSLMNTREPWPADERFLAAQDELLQGLIAERGVVTLGETEPAPADARLRLVRGALGACATLPALRGADGDEPTLRRHLYAAGGMVGMLARASGSSEAKRRVSVAFLHERHLWLVQRVAEVLGVSARELMGRLDGAGA